MHLIITVAMWCAGMYIDNMVLKWLLRPTHVISTQANNNNNYYYDIYYVHETVQHIEINTNRTKTGNSM